MDYALKVSVCGYLLNDNYTNESQIITVDKKAPDFPGEGNGLLQTGLWYAVRASAARLSEENCATIEDILSRCQHDKAPIYWRSPHKKNPGDTNKQDDYFGILAMCYHSKNDRALKFYNYGEYYEWIINIEQPQEITWHTIDLNYYFDRFPGFRIFAKAAAIPSGGPRLTLREHLEACLVAAYITWKAPGSDAAMRDYCWFSVLARESLPVALISFFWLKQITKKFGSMGQAWAPYFKSNEHPLTRENWKL